MAIEPTNEVRIGVQEIADALRSRLQRYIEAAYHLRDQGVVAERRALLAESEAIAREPFLETTPSYELSTQYSKLRLPRVIGTTLDEFARWQPGIGIFPKPYRHQAEALEAFFNNNRDLIVSTGTGSGKTETFLLPILGSLLEEAANRPKSFQLSGFRALLLYPMNALVSDQIARLRRLIGDERLSALFRTRYGRHPRFGMYTSRTPYPGSPNAKKDKRHLDTVLRYYLDIEDAARRDGLESGKAHLMSELQSRGRWPAKDLHSFFDQGFRTQRSDQELLTRHEIQLSCPDILVTNYSMLEYMLMRPIERNIFEQTRKWLASDPNNNLILVVDEAHLYRGTAGAEVAYLIRRLQARLAIPRERLRCILTSASLGSDATIESDALAFAEALTGSPAIGGRSFQLVQGYREPRPPTRLGTTTEAAALASFDQAALARHAQNLDQVAAAVSTLGSALRWPTPPLILEGESNATLRAHLYQCLYGLGPVELLISETTGRATSLSDIAAKLFPDAAFDTALRATETILSLGAYAHNGQRPLLQTRVHMLFRGLPSLWACVSHHCSARINTTRHLSLLGRLYTEPRTHCECGARVYELLAHRDCGAVFLRVFGDTDQASFYWHEEGRRVDLSAQQLQENWLIVERPLRKYEEDGLVEPIWMDVTTGRVEVDAPAELEHYRQFWRSTEKSRAKSRGDDEGLQSTTSFPFERCPICTRRTPDKILDLATRGERPFANIIHEQFTSQLPSRPFNEEFPNGGRKVLIFADGRQKAARLARDLPREVEFDTFRQAITLAVARLQELGREPTLGTSLYAAFVSVCYDLRLHFFDQEFGSQQQLLKHMRDFQHYYDADLETVLSEQEAAFAELPMRYRQHLLDQIANPFYAVYNLGAMVVKPTRATIKRMQRDLAQIPEAASTNIEVIATFWGQTLLERGAFDKSIPPHVRDRVSAYAKPPKYGATFRDLEKVLREGGNLSDEHLKYLRKSLYNALTEQDEYGLSYLKPAVLALNLAFDHTWLRCAACGNFQHTPLLGRCAVCGGQQLNPCLPDDPTTSARYDYYRAPLRDILRGARPAHLTAEEHTAQLSQRDIGTVYATTEEFELRFQDIALDEEHPPVDVLSCTTTMEVGIDIGSLVAIGMRNVPPQRENYQQRAGRAGRRGSAISTVVTYADSGPHDHFYYQQPQGMIAGDPRRPLLNIDRQTLARRHICAYLLQTFFQEQIDNLASGERERLQRERKSLFTALGSQAEFFIGNGPLSFTSFRSWVNTKVETPKGDVARTAATWLPDEAVPGGGATKIAFVADTALSLITYLEHMASQAPQQHKGENATRSDGEFEERGLLDALFDEGLLPSYAFPTDLATFYVFGRDGEKVTIKERPQQSKAQALSEYAPGRLLVVNKETYRVGGIYVFGEGYDAPMRSLFARPLPAYVYCPKCTYMRLTPLHSSEKCPVCHTELKANELLDPPGFSPEGGQPVRDRDHDQEISYAAGAQLPLPVVPDNLEWHKGSWPNMRYAYAENQRFVMVNRGPHEEGFIICEACGATWPTVSAPQSGLHNRPYLMPSHYGRSQCRGELHKAPLYLGTTFRSDLLLIRSTLQPPFGYTPSDPWLRDALRTMAEALALAASRVLDVDPSELSAGHRLLPHDGSNGSASFDLYLFDTAAGGAGYAAEAGMEIGTILLTALDLVEGCPRQCERSCTSCLRHYGNRFWHSTLDRRLAAQVLRHLMYGEVPAVASVEKQRILLTPLRRFLELEGWHIEDQHSDIPLLVRWNERQIAVGVYPALLDEQVASFTYTRGSNLVWLRDYVVARDLPAAYAQLRRVVRSR